MQYDLTNSSVKMELRRRVLPYGIVSLILGLLLVSISTARLWSFYSKYCAGSIEEYLAQYRNPSIPLVTEAAATLFAGIAVVMGLRFLLDAYFMLRRKLIPANVPGGLDIGQTIGSITGKSLLAPVEEPKFRLPWLNSIRFMHNRPVSFFGLRSVAWEQMTTLGFIPCIITAYAASLARRAFVWLILFACLYGLMQIKYEQLFQDIPEQFGPAFEAVRSVPWPAAVFAVLAWIVALAASIYFLIGADPQRAEVELQTQEITCAKQPQMVYDLFEDVSRSIQRDNMPNRVTKIEDHQVHNSGVGMSRDFCRQVFVEQQPKLVESQTRIAGYVATALGSVSIFWALRNLTTPVTSVDTGIAAVIYGGLGSLILLGAGMRVMRIGMILSHYLRFESLAFFVDIRGQVSRSMVVVGAGRHDSVKSENETNRSEILLTYRSARLITEADSLFSSRLLFAMHVDDELISVTRELQKSLEARTGTGVAIAGINIANQSVADVVNMNIAIHSMGGKNNKSIPKSNTISLLPSTPQSEQTNGTSNTTEVLNRAVRLRAKAMLALKKFHKDDDQEFDHFEDSAFEEAESLFLSGEKFFSNQQYAESISAFEGVIELGSVGSQ